MIIPTSQVIWTKFGLISTSHLHLLLVKHLILNLLSSWNLVKKSIKKLDSRTGFQGNLNQTDNSIEVTFDDKTYDDKRFLFAWPISEEDRTRHIGYVVRAKQTVMNVTVTKKNGTKKNHIAKPYNML